MLYERVDVYRRSQEKIIVYRCLRLLSGAGYIVQSADWLNFPLSAATLIDHELRFCELLMEESPEVRSSPFPTIDEAIRAFDAEFGNVS